jgi:hypothetical protein
MAFTVGRYGIKSIGLARAADRHLLRRLHLLRRRGARPAGAPARFKLWQLMRYIREELLVVLGTSSSEPVLPRLLMKLERSGCKKGVVGLVLPDRLFVQSRRHGDLPDAGIDVHRAGLRHPPVRWARSLPCWA